MKQNGEEIKTKVFSGLFWKFGERITAQLVSFIVSIVLARLLLPSDYGAIALVMVFISVANVFVSNGFGSALIQKKDADNVDFSSVFYFNILFSIIIYLILFISAPYIADFYRMSILSNVIRVLGIRIPIAAINSVQQAYVSRHMLFKKFFWSTLFGTIFSGVIGIILAFQGFGVWALVAQYLSNTMIDTAVLWVTVPWRPACLMSFHRLKYLLKYGWKLLCAGLLDTGYAQLRSLVIGKIYNSEDLAFYNKGDQFANLVIVNVNSSISSVLFPAISNAQDDIETVKSMTRRAIKVSSFMIWPIMLGLVAIAKPLIRFVLTDKWLNCVPYLRIACITYAFWPVHTANLEAIKAVGRSDLFLYLEIVKKVLGIILLLLAIPQGVIAIAMSGLITSIISTFINAYPNRQLLGYSYIEQIKDMLGAMIMSVLMCVVLVIINTLYGDGMYVLCAQIIIGVLVYFLEARLINDESYKYILSIIREFLIKKKK